MTNRPGGQAAGKFNKLVQDVLPIKTGAVTAPELTRILEEATKLYWPAPEAVKVALEAWMPAGKLTKPEAVIVATCRPSPPLKASFSEDSAWTAHKDEDSGSLGERVSQPELLIVEHVPSAPPPAWTETSRYSWELFSVKDSGIGETLPMTTL